MLVFVVGLAVLAGLFFGLFALLGLRDRTLWSSLLVILGPALDAGLTAWLLVWFGLGPVLSVLTGAMVGLASSLLIPTVLWPRRALVGRLAVRSLRARPKQAALLLVALIVSPPSFPPPGGRRQLGRHGAASSRRGVDRNGRGPVRQGTPGRLNPSCLRPGSSPRWRPKPWR